MHDGCRQKHSIENYGQTAADMRHGCYWQLIGICHRRNQRRPYHWYEKSAFDLDLAYRLATILHDWHSRVCNDLSRSCKVGGFHVIWKHLCQWSTATLAYRRFWHNLRWLIGWKMHIFPTPPLLNPKSENFVLNRWNFVYETRTGGHQTY